MTPATSPTCPMCRLPTSHDSASFCSCLPSELEAYRRGVEDGRRREREMVVASLREREGGYVARFWLWLDKQRDSSGHVDRVADFIAAGAHVEER